MHGNTKKVVNRGLAWAGAASSLVWILDIVSYFVILKFWISDAEYGVAALAITLFPVLDLATDIGLSAAVIQRDDHSERKLSTVFWINLTMSILVVGILAVGVGPLLGWLHGHAVIGLLLTAYGAKLLWQNGYLIPAALMRKQLRFRELQTIRAVANVAEFAGKIGFAAGGFGVWCFVLGPLCRVVVTGIGVQLRCPWRPRCTIGMREALDWAVFGLKTSASQILFHIYTNLDYQVVGYFFGERATGLYKFAYDLALEPCRMISETLHQIAFPAYVRLKRNRKQLVEQLISFTRLTMVVMLGFLGILFITVEDILLLWDERWLPAASVARILCMVGVLRALSYVVPPLLDAVGRPGLTLIYTACAAIVLPLFFVAGAYWLGNVDGPAWLGFPPGETIGYLSVAAAWIIGYPIAFAVLVIMALRMLELSLSEYLKRVGGVALCAGVATIAAGIVRYWLLDMGVGVRLLGGGVVMVGVFLGLLAYWQGIHWRSVVAGLRSN